MDLQAALSSVGFWTAEDEDGEELGVGSCWPITSDLVVTNYHVASMGPKARVELEGTGSMPVVGVVAHDKPRDIAIAKIRAGKHSPMPFSTFDDLPRVGTDVYVLGSPLGLKQSVTRGIVSAIRCSADLAEFGFKARKQDCFVQLDAAINPGSSGGPIVDDSGRVVAMSTALLSGAQGMNFAVPVTYVLELLDTKGRCKSLSSLQANRSRAGTSPRSQSVAASQQSGDLGFSDALLRLYMILMAADGWSTEYEVAQMLVVADEWGLTAGDLDLARQRMERDAQYQDLGDMAAEAAGFLGAVLNPAQQRAVLEDLIRIADADGADQSEALVVAIVASAWGFS